MHAEASSAKRGSNAMLFYENVANYERGAGQINVISASFMTALKIVACERWRQFVGYINVSED